MVKERRRREREKNEVICVVSVCKAFEEEKTAADIVFPPSFSFFGVRWFL
jgi:hypothetical protein